MQILKNKNNNLKLNKGDETIEKDFTRAAINPGKREMFKVLTY